MAPALLAVIAFVIVLPLAFLSWTLIEKPALRLRPHITALWMKRAQQVTIAG